MLPSMLPLVPGGGLIAFGFYIYDKKFGPDYVYIPLAAIGMFVICTVFFSTCGASCWNSCWACCLYPISALMGFLLALGEITAGSLLLAYRKRYSNWLDQNHQKYNISDNELEHLKHGILTVSIGFFALAVLEVLRICVSRGYKYGRRYDEEQQRMMDDYEDMERRERADSRNRERREKHARLRAHYSQKYDL
eukprot:jgi/Bigna1/85661/estExt_fgenesh1_pg.C_50152